jgi:Pleckstrin homology domain
MSGQQKPQFTVRLAPPPSSTTRTHRRSRSQGVSPSLSPRSLAYIASTSPGVSPGVSPGTSPARTHRRSATISNSPKPKPPAITSNGTDSDDPFASLSSRVLSVKQHDQVQQQPPRSRSQRGVRPDDNFTDPFSLFVTSAMNSPDNKRSKNNTSTATTDTQEVDFLTDMFANTTVAASSTSTAAAAAAASASTTHKSQWDQLQLPNFDSDDNNDDDDDETRDSVAPLPLSPKGRPTFNPFGDLSDSSSSSDEDDDTESGNRAGAAAAIAHRVHEHHNSVPKRGHGRTQSAFISPVSSPNRPAVPISKRQSHPSPRAHLAPPGERSPGKPRSHRRTRSQPFHTSPPPPPPPGRPPAHVHARAEIHRLTREAAADGKNKQLIDVLPFLRHGAALYKFGRRGFPHFRHFHLEKNNQTLAWFSKHKKMHETQIDVEDINEIVTGQTTPNFRRSDAAKGLENGSFTIFYNNRKKSLDVVAKDPIELQVWVGGLQLLAHEVKMRRNVALLKSLMVPVLVTADMARPDSKSLGTDPTQLRETQTLLQKKFDKQTKSILDISPDKYISSSHQEHLSNYMDEIADRFNHVAAHLRVGRLADASEQLWQLEIDLQSLHSMIEAAQTT